MSFALLRNGVKSFCSHFAEYHLTIILDLDLKLELQNQSLKWSKLQLLMLHTHPSDRESLPKW